MKFTAREPIGSFYILGTLLVLNLFAENFFVLAYLIPFVILQPFLRYELHVEEDEMRFLFKFLQYTIITRRVTPDQIRRIIFKRAAWSTKQVVIRVRGKLRWHIIRFEPDGWSEAVRDFADRHGVQVRLDPYFKYL